jgi:hypothetical protein
MCRVEVKESMEWLRNAFVGSPFGMDILREELENAMAETPQMHDLMERNSEEDDEEGSDREDDDWESDMDKDDEKEDRKEGAGKSETTEQETVSRARTAHFHVIRHIAA